MLDFSASQTSPARVLRHDDQDPMGLVRSLLADVARGMESLVQGRKLANGPGAMNRAPAEERLLGEHQQQDQQQLLNLIHHMVDEVAKRDEAMVRAKAAISQLNHAVDDLDSQEAKGELEEARDIQEQQQRVMNQEREELLERISQTAKVLQAPKGPSGGAVREPALHSGLPPARDSVAFIPSPKTDIPAVSLFTGLEGEQPW